MIRTVLTKPSVVLSTILFISLLYFSYLMILITLQYIPVDFDVAFLRIKQEEIARPHYQVAFFTHVYSSIVVHLAGMFQFSGWLRRKFPGTHQILGYVYIIFVLLFAAPSGLVMGYYANGGSVARVSFCLLAILWFTFTWMALAAAKRNNRASHRNFMIRSYALTLSAISLRLFKYIIVNVFALPPIDTYQIVAIAGWVVNLLIAEWIIRKIP